MRDYTFSVATSGALTSFTSESFESALGSFLKKKYDIDSYELSVVQYGHYAANRSTDSGFVDYHVSLYGLLECTFRTFIAKVDINPISILSITIAPDYRPKSSHQHEIYFSSVEDYKGIFELDNQLKIIPVNLYSTFYQQFIKERTFILYTEFLSDVCTFNKLYTQGVTSADDIKGVMSI